MRHLVNKNLRSHSEERLCYSWSNLDVPLQNLTLFYVAFIASYKGYSSIPYHCTIRIFAEKVRRLLNQTKIPSINVCLIKLKIRV